MSEHQSNPRDSKVFYLCDRRACESCNSIADGECKHTTDIGHAKNFELIGNGFFEKEIPPLNKNECS